jgi:hypothetical protein
MFHVVRELQRTTVYTLSTFHLAVFKSRHAGNNENKIIFRMTWTPFTLPGDELVILVTKA